MVNFVNTAFALLATAASVTAIPATKAVPAGCTATYFVESGDTCTGIINKFGNFTGPALYEWNTNLGLKCDLFAGDVLCINKPPYNYEPTTPGQVLTAAQHPFPQQPDIVNGCTKFAFTTSGGSPGLASILRNNNISRRDWQIWNWPQNDADSLSAVWAGYFSCVSVN